MAKTILNGALFSPWQVLESANAYYALSLVFTSKLPIYVSATEPVVNMDEAMASATNRILALELYLKALLIGANAEFPADHDLPKLYRCLQADIQIEVEKEFDKKKHIANNPKIIAQGIHWFQLTSQPGQTIAKRAKPKPVDNTLAGLLERNRRAFMDSRYLFDQAKFEESSVFLYEHLRLAILCDVICTLLEELLPNRYQSYERKFSFYPAELQAASA
jgi:hypothetical protein